MGPVQLNEKSVRNLVDASLEVLSDYGYFTQCLWHVDDIHLLCEQRGWPKLEHEEARAIFAIFAELYEGEQGMTWAKLEQATQVYLAQQGNIKNLHGSRSISAAMIQELIAGDALSEYKEAPDLSAFFPAPSKSIDMPAITGSKVDKARWEESNA